MLEDYRDARGRSDAIKKAALNKFKSYYAKAGAGAGAEVYTVATIMNRLAQPLVARQDDQCIAQFGCHETPHQDACPPPIRPLVDHLSNAYCHVLPGLRRALAYLTHARTQSL